MRAILNGIILSITTSKGIHCATFKISLKIATNLEVFIKTQMIHSLNPFKNCENYSVAN